MRDLQSFPTSNEGFEALVRSARVDPSEWVGPEFNEKIVLTFLFLGGLRKLVDAPPRLFDRSYIDRELAKSKENPRYWLDPFVPLVDRMLQAGVSPEDMSKLVTMMRKEVVGSVLYFLDDPACVYAGDIPDKMRFHLYTEDENEQPILESRSDWSLLHQLWNSVEPNDDMPDAKDSV